MLDTGALIAFERNLPRVRRLVELAVLHRVPLYVPAGVLAQAWRDGSRHVRLARLVGSAAVTVRPLDELEAQAAGVLCGARGTSDVVDASVVIAARVQHAVVLTSDAGDIRHLDPSLDVVAC
ncbi:MAG: PIN domain nuclease [Deltaproteobacteria bacterium]|nr:PIN domain nuclease [Deltaproteobacteria bacterium]